MIVDESKWDDLSNYRDSLEHYGRQGMEWYKHKFGKEQSHAKYQTSGSSSDKKKTFKERRADAAKKREAEKKAKEKAKAEKKEADAKAKAEKEAKQKEEERQKILKSPSKLYKHREEFTYDEIKKAMERFKWEEDLHSYSKKELERSANVMKAMVNNLDNAINLYNACTRIVNSVASDGKKNILPYIGGGDQKKNSKQAKAAEKDKKKDEK